jgi:hypothetical protein
MDAFAFGIRPDDGEPLELIDRADWKKEIEAAKADELNWDGERVPIRLMVEMPFWLMMPDCEISVGHEQVTVLATVSGDYAEVSAGNTYFNSHATVVYVGPADRLKSGEIPPAIANTEMPIYRHMQSVVLFQPEALKEAFDAWQETEVTTPDRNRRIRRKNQARQYFRSFAFAHIPFLNHLIRSYRSTSYDPFAFEVSEQDVPVWFAQYGDTLVRIGLVPYSDADTYPELITMGTTERRKFFATTKDAVQLQATIDVTPGKLELLDALSLYQRGRFGDAVRSAVTAIEVAVEAQLLKSLKEKGYTAEQSLRRLGETRNSFQRRLEDYEKVSQKRLPSPLVSWIPTINGVRLKSELGWVRELRHKVVHEGVRVDIFRSGQMQRAIETMTWLFRWLSCEDYSNEDNRNFTFFNSANNRKFLPIEYTANGVVVRPYEFGNESKTCDALVGEQYIASITDFPCDVELFTKMSLTHLGIAGMDAPPENPDDPLLRETFHISHNGRKSLVFCLDFDGLLDAATVGRIALRTLAHIRSSGQECGSLCVVHHQRHIPPELREIEDAISEDVRHTASECGLTLVTTTDLCLLLQAAAAYKWNVEDIRNILFLPGRQGMSPPAYRRIGDFLRFYDRQSVMSVQLDAGETVNVGDTLGIRLAARYCEETIESLQVEHESVQTASGPSRVGIKTKVRKADLRIGQPVYIRT